MHSTWPGLINYVPCPGCHGSGREITAATTSGGRCMWCGGSGLGQWEAYDMQKHQELERN